MNKMTSFWISQDTVSSSKAILSCGIYDRQCVCVCWTLFQQYIVRHVLNSVLLADYVPTIIVSILAPKTNYKAGIPHSKSELILRSARINVCTFERERENCPHIANAHLLVGADSSLHEMGQEVTAMPSRHGNGEARQPGETVA